MSKSPKTEDSDNHNGANLTLEEFHNRVMDAMRKRRGYSLEGYYGYWEGEEVPRTEIKTGHNSEGNHE